MASILDRKISGDMYLPSLITQVGRIFQEHAVSADLLHPSRVRLIPCSSVFCCCSGEVSTSPYQHVVDASQHPTAHKSKMDYSCPFLRRRNMAKAHPTYAARPAGDDGLIPMIQRLTRALSVTRIFSQRIECAAVTSPELNATASYLGW